MKIIIFEDTGFTNKDGKTELVLGFNGNPSFEAIKDEIVKMRADHPEGYDTEDILDAIPVEYEVLNYCGRISM